MEGDSLSQRKAQLDKAEREHLEDIVEELRERVENNVRFQLTQKGLDDEPKDTEELDEETQQLVEAIDLEAVDGHTWDEAFEQYVTGVGYTIVNRLAALRCMEVRDFVNEEVTVFKDNGLTPAAETLVHEEFLLEDEAVLEAYHNACNELTEEIEILFDRSTAYSLIDPDNDTFEESCGMLDEVPDEVWRADDVLGWVYEYYNVKLLDDLRKKGNREGLDPEDVPPANQFYTPHWVVRMLTDNSLGKLYLEHTGDLQDVIEAQEALSADERKNRPLSPNQSPDIADFCTYLVPSREEDNPTDFEHPKELRVIDPACGSGHFLLYAFDVLERIWREETDIDTTKIPRKILKHNLYGVDLDMRACQLAAFNLYLKGRTRTEAEGADGFDMPEIGIVCADAAVADVEGVEEVFAEVADQNTNVADALRRILEAFEEIHGLGSLLDVRGTLRDLFEDDTEMGGVQITLSDDPHEDHTLSQVLHSLREAVDEHRDADSFLAQDLRSFIRLLDVLAQDYDVALMNPPYGSGGLMPDSVQNYVEDHYHYSPQFYVNFFEVCNQLSKESGRIGMLIPRTFMFKRSFEDFREDFIGPLGSFDFLAEFGLGILDNATVRTAATVVRKETKERGNRSASFIRLHDVEADKKEGVFLNSVFNAQTSDKRVFEVDVAEFKKIPGTPMSYWAHPDVRALYDSEHVLDSENANLDRKSGGRVKEGLTSGNNDRFVSYFWENGSDDWVPLATARGECLFVSITRNLINWHSDGEEVKRVGSSYVRNEDYYFSEALTYKYHGEGGRRFGYIPSGAVFDRSGKIFIPNSDSWTFLAYLNSSLVTYLMLCQTSERRWEVGQVSKIPWFPNLADNDEIETRAHRLGSLLMKINTSDISSFNYSGPLLLEQLGIQESFSWHSNHKFSSLYGELPSLVSREASDPSTPITQLAAQSDEHIQNIHSRLVEELEHLDRVVMDAVGLSDDIQEVVQEEVSTQTPAKDGYEGEIEYLVDLPNPTEENQARDLLLHFALDSVVESEDGIVPITFDSDAEPTLLNRIEERFEDVFGEHATDRMFEIDQIIGDISPEEESYPNIRKWIEQDLFEYHVNQFENTPIMWEVTTENLVTDADRVGFSCLIDYHQLDASIFDKISNRYIEPQKASIREKRTTADRRKSNDDLTAKERARATERYKRCNSALEQIVEFEQRIQALAEEQPRDWNNERQQAASELKYKVQKFREETQRRLNLLDELAAQADTDMTELFTETFYSTVQEKRDEWIDALYDLEEACDAYSKDANEAVQAHHYDLFGYFDDLIGSTHFASNGILFMTYYFEDGKKFLENGSPRGGLRDDVNILADLAIDLEDYIELAEKINEECGDLAGEITSNWADRALSDIMTTGYRPNHKYGVAINITPLSEAEIVPKIVNNQVI